MRVWLPVAGIVQLAAAAAASAQVGRNPFAPLNAVTPAKRTADFSLHGGSWINDPGPFDGGLIKKEDVATDTIVGLGLVKMRGRKRNGSDMQPGADVEVQKRNPAVTVVLKF